MLITEQIMIILIYEFAQQLSVSCLQIFFTWTTILDQAYYVNPNCCCGSLSYVDSDWLRPDRIRLSHPATTRHVMHGAVAAVDAVDAVEHSAQMLCWKQSLLL